MVEESPALIRLEEHVNAYLRSNDNVGYNRFTDFEWEKLKDSITESGMTDLHVGAVETAMLVEDHIPGYGAEYTRLFMVHEGRTDEEAVQCRQMLHFVFRWVAEEDRHAHVLELWLRHSGRRTAGTVTAPPKPTRFWAAPSDARPAGNDYEPSATGHQTRPDHPIYRHRLSCAKLRQVAHGVWRSLVARFVRDEEVVGSNPATPTRG